MDLEDYYEWKDGVIHVYRIGDIMEAAAGPANRQELQSRIEGREGIEVGDAWAVVMEPEYMKIIPKTLDGGDLR